MSNEFSMGNEIPVLTFSEELKARTAIPHKKLEQHSASLAIISPLMCTNDYVKYLLLMHCVVRDIETNVFPMAVNLFPDLEKRKKLEAIEEDIKILGARIPQSKAVFTLPRSEAFAAGMVYVIEGSTLGGRYILKNILNLPEFADGKATRYFTGYGNVTGSRWKEFMHQLTAYEAVSGNSDEITAGAAYAFEAILNHFERQTAGYEN